MAFEGNGPKIRSFTDLNAWQEGHKLVLLVYGAVKDFPGEERYGLSDQLRRAAVSITSNIAEGFSRQSSKEKLQFYFIAKGSNTELQNQLLIAKDINYLEPNRFQELLGQSNVVGRLLTGLIKYCKS